MTIEISLPLPPPLSQLTFNRGKTRATSAKYKLWLQACPKLQPLALSNVFITYRIWFRGNHVSDLANREKAITDYLVSQKVIVDDSWQHLKQLTLVAMGIDKANPRVEITIHEAG